MPDSRDPLTYAILGAVFEVANTLGHGFLEAVYHRALTEELRLRGLPARREVVYPVVYKGAEVGHYVADLVVADKVILELKSVPALVSAHVAQTLNYLKASGLPVALLVNFGRAEVEYRRLVLS